ncbi:MAG: hypothetical protein KBD00_01950 [Candidatus Peribacteraceae bacterium]|nr:hypothetical protein [Candidatus Peribacteraceae bacterium]
MALHKKTFEELSAHPGVAVSLGKQINSQTNDVSRTTRDALLAAMGKTGQKKIISTRKDQAHSDLVKLKQITNSLPSNVKTDFKQNVVDSLNPVHRSGLKHVDVSPSINEMRTHLQENPAAPAATTSTPAVTPPPPNNSGGGSSPEKEGVVNWVKAHPVKSVAAATVGLGVLGSGVLANAGPLATTSYNTVMNTPILGAVTHGVINGGSYLLNGAGSIMNTLATNVPILKAIPPAISSVSTNIANYTGLSTVLPAYLTPWAGGILGLTAIGAIKRARERALGQKNKEYKTMLGRLAGTTLEGAQFIGTGAKKLVLSPLTITGWSLGKMQALAEKTWKTTSKFAGRQLKNLKPTKYGVGGAAVGALILSNFFAPGVAVAPLIWGAGGYLAGNYYARRNKGGIDSHSHDSHRSSGEGSDGDGDED